MAFYREPTHVREPGELPERKPVGGQLEEQVAGNDHLLGADGDGAALIDVSSAKRNVGSNKRNRARHRDLRDAGGLLGLCHGSAPAEHEQGHEGRYKEGETPLAGVAPCGATPACGSHSEEFFCIRHDSSPFHCQSLAKCFRYLCAVKDMCGVHRHPPKAPKEW